MTTTAAPVKTEKAIVPSVENQKGIDNHKKAADHHEEAAKHHHEAAKQHEDTLLKGNDEAYNLKLKNEAFEGIVVMRLLQVGKEDRYVP